MKKRIKNYIWISLAFSLIAVLVFAKLRPAVDITAAELEPSGVAANVPVPAKPLFKKSDAEDITTVVAEPPQANGVNGAPQIMKNELGLEVSPLCFEQFFNVDQPVKKIDITTCEKMSGYVNIQTGLVDGEYQTSYSFPAEPDMPAETGLASYQLLGTTPEGTAIQTYSETGGTGRFSSILLTSLKGNMLTLNRHVIGGDRCNGGIVQSKVENGSLIYSINITPGDFPAIAWDQDKGLTAYEDLEASAMSCFATAIYTDDVLTSVELNPDALKEAGDWSDQYTYQKCFNSEFKKAIEAGNRVMSPEKFKSFMDSFFSICVGKKP